MRRGYPTPRLEAIAQGLFTYYTGKPCKRGHISIRYVSHGNCVDCCKDKKEYLQRYSKSENGKISCRKAGRSFRKNNPHKHCAVQAKRRVMKFQRTPSWADMLKIESIYADAQRITKETGIEHHVDHIIPLKNKFVSGLHVSENLQVIPKMDNIAKSNRFQV